MTEKCKLNDLAKDLGVSNKEIIDLIEKKFGEQKKATTVLVDKELNFVVEHYSRKGEVQNFDRYFADGDKKRADRAAAKQAEPKKEQKPAEKAPVKGAEKREEKKPAAKSGDRPAQAKQSAPQHGKQNKKPAAARQNTTTLDTRSAQKTEKVEVKQSVTHVDTRAANVELDKYNERYEKIAPTSAPKDNFVKKQKLNQRSSRRGKPVKSRREQEAEKLRRLELERQRRQRLEIKIPDEITVGELAARLKVQAAEIIKRLMAVGVMASVSEVIDYDTAALVAMEIGAKVEREVFVTIEERLFEQEEDTDENLVKRCPVVVVMGHVDHGKTSLLDAIRKTNVTTGEAGGITQHIGAYQVTINGEPITFLDTPGHEAFTSMRARGAQITDIAVLVVAADDGIMPQTVEAINHAKAAGVSIIVAINKIDKPAANPEKVKQELTEYGLVPEEWGGDVICVPVSAKAGTNIDTLLEMINLVADVQELKANPDRMASGAVIEAKLDKGRGPVATILVQNGTLHTGDIIIAGSALGRVRVMQDDRGNRITEAGPSTPVEVTGLGEVPAAGDTFHAVEDERLAKELVEQRKQEAKEVQFSAYKKVTLDNLFSQISEGEMKELPIIVKADVQGSVEAVKQSLEKISNEEVRVRVIHGAVGAVSESDVMLANASNAIIVGFNVRPDPVAKEMADRDDVEIRLYRVIYDAIDEITDAMKGMLAPKYRDVDLGRAEVRQVYKISNVGTVAGCYVLDGKMARNAKIRVVRDGIIIADDEMSSLKRFKDDAKEVAKGFECGITLNKFNDIKEGDIFEAYIVEEYRD
ncbi:MAG: translation initiation factor IF-2 [Clostridiales bacterium]|nr:translation initiation factor IF-2 [Clostridiales bacterium]